MDERGTSSQCPRCGSKEVVKNNGRRFKCKDCGLEAHRDAVGCINIAKSIGLAHFGGEVINGAVACPLLSEAGTSHALACEDVRMLFLQKHSEGYLRILKE